MTGGGPAAAEAAAGHSDFDGDGFADLAIGAPGEDVGRVADAGVVHVLYGGPGGLSATGSQLWSQNSVGIADVVEPGDRFGTAVAVGDFNFDGFGDLAVGVPDEDGRTTTDSGAMHVIYGSTSGLSAAGSSVWSQDSAAVPDVAEAGDHFGAALTHGNFGGPTNPEGATFVDLAVGVPGENLGTIADAGVVQAFYGSAAQLLPGNVLWNQETGGIADTAEAGDHFGSALAAGDFGDSAGSTRTDLAVGVPDEDIGAVTDAGAVHVILGGFDGLTATSSQFWSQNSAGITDAAEPGDHFGSALTADDFGRGPYADLAIGVPDEDARAVTDVGVVQVIYAATGPNGALQASGSQYW
jgi:hypothetical protein